MGCRTVSDDSTFVSLGGDSLSYVEMSVRLEEMLEELPADWHTTTVGELATLQASPRRRSWWRPQRLEMTVVLRAVAILLIVGSHSNVFMLLGGAHVLLGVAGFNSRALQPRAADSS